MTAGPAGWSVDADLTISVDAGPGRGTTAHVTGSGQDLHVRAERPDLLLAAAGGTASGPLARELSAAGLTAELHGPRGRVLSLDPGRTSRLGALVFASRHVVVDKGGWRVLASSVWHRARASRSRPGRSS
ncbi:hypothetical protein EV383_5549 [Pseudonocardia sediminis]|uniref:Uncharacterized protein n=1 Tax=Pseudonocardia sediminis TaxID=1397368 RepID=A0A4Q7V3B6_PSEST|nr:hypothetical protein [Pseudonocardia sediminis]RZT88605.1 hypothetical protein EV383_5549 [Pseudonocardia sediminis]